MLSRDMNGRLLRDLPVFDHDTQRRAVVAFIRFLDQIGRVKHDVDLVDAFLEAEIRRSLVQVSPG